MSTQHEGDPTTTKPEPVRGWVMPRPRTVEEHPQDYDPATTQILVVACTNSKRVHAGDPEYVAPDGRILVTTHYEASQWWGVTTPPRLIARLEGTREEAVEWAEQQGTTDIEIQEPSWATPTSWRSAGSSA